MNSQGITVQYINGMRGGLFIYTEDDDFGEKINLLSVPAYNTEGHLKSLVNPRKMVLLNPHYYERQALTDQIFQISNDNLRRVGMAINPFNKNEEATVDRFTQLSGYGTIQVYSHGMAWPNKHNITEVYLMTGEEANVNTSKKYWQELKDGNIPVMKVSSTSNKYFLSPQFIEDHNDFSNDTILFYGGFCYSFLGNWPDLVNSFANGAYTGFDWRVKTFNNANRSVNSIALMSDTTKNQPMTLQGWMDDPGVAKSYWDNGDSRTTSIHYVGDGSLTLWNDVGVSLITLSPDGAPVSVPGKAGEEYPFKCTVVTNISPLQYVWDIGDGSSPVATDGNEVWITWSENGTYLLTVEVKNKNTGEFIGSAQLSVKIGGDDTGIVEFAKSCNNFAVRLEPGLAIDQWAQTSCSWYIELANFQWDGMNFSAQQSYNGLITHSVEGTLGSNGQTISCTITKEGILYDLDLEDFSLSMTIEDYPYYSFTPGDYGNITFMKDPPGPESYVTNVEGYVKVEDVPETVYISNANFDWNKVTLLEVMFYKSPGKFEGIGNEAKTRVKVKE